MILNYCTKPLYKLSTLLTIGICFTEAKYANYPAWIQGNDPNIEVVPLSWETQDTAVLQQCHGLLLTGGIDTDPFFYQPDVTEYPNMPAQWNRARDEFEITVFNQALELKMPVLGICRGLQLVNIALGGSLVTDIEATGKQNHRAMAGKDYRHEVILEKQTLLSEIACIGKGEVNSAHHQSIALAANSLLINCFAPENIPEGIEWKDKENKSPLLCVQWHPERIDNKETNPLSKNIRDWFLLEAKKYSYERN